MSSSSPAWLVGSQQGFLGNLDDCIIHGIFTDKALATACISHMQNEYPNDTFGLVPVPLNRNVHLGFNLNHSWNWYKPLLHTLDAETDSCSSLLIPEDATTESGSNRLNVQHVQPQLKAVCKVETLT
jgi:hypothetical protein